MAAELKKRLTMHISKITIENFRCFGEGDNRLELLLHPGVTALVGENDMGKTAVIDALRFALGTTDQEWVRLDDADFRPTEKTENSRPEDKKFKEIRIVCKFEGLSDEDKRAFIEYLSYDEVDGKQHQILYVNWTAENTGETRKGRPYRRVEVHSGKNGDGPIIALEAREFLRATYLRPLRDAEESLLAGRGSRLAQVLGQSSQIQEGQETWDDSTSLKELKLNVRGIAKLVNHLLEKHKGVEVARDEINKNLSQLAILGDSLASIITVGGAKASPDTQLAEVEQGATSEFAVLEAAAREKHHCSREEVLASHIYAKFANDGVSKPIAAQYLAERLQRRHDKENLTPKYWQERLPNYLIAAIDYVTSAVTPTAPVPKGKTTGP